ncbi:hypothetical protein Zm00014a_032147 [Zea mays]|uniref:Uncharacterized protein n=1 Tax=Zea mays TaxID=4577 RepID=A0A317Y4R9_MAIZE|nr:hypothetical protein Zm00014a_032147 [Zea mays]
MFNNKFQNNTENINTARARQSNEVKDSLYHRFTVAGISQFYVIKQKTNLRRQDRPKALYEEKISRRKRKYPNPCLTHRQRHRAYVKRITTGVGS